jgi:hypothetical protein
VGVCCDEFELFDLVDEWAADPLSDEEAAVAAVGAAAAAAAAAAGNEMIFLKGKEERGADLSREGGFWGGLMMWRKRHNGGCECE